jgi:hypothetical protein
MNKPVEEVVVAEALVVVDEEVTVVDSAVVEDAADEAVADITPTINCMHIVKSSKGKTFDNY